MIITKVRKWGNSFGVIIPKDELRERNICENQEIIIEITKKENPLKELFGFSRKNKISREEFLKTRKLLERGI